MQLLRDETGAATAAHGCAHEVLDVLPLVMRVVRRELRKCGPRELSLPQFRTLAFLNQQNASLSELADHIGLTLPAMSRLVDGLVAGGLASRTEDPHDRRRIVLALTPAGQEVVRAALAGTETYLAGVLGALSQEQLETIHAAMGSLRSLFGRA